MSQPPVVPSDDKPAGPETPDDKGSDGGKELKPLSRWAWVLVPTFLVAYPLSIGPVARLARAGVIPASVVMSLEKYFYGPLVFLCEWIPGFAWLLRGYVDLWSL